MASTFGGLQIGYSGLQTHQQALNVTGHNIANASNEDYSRQQVDLKATTPLYMPGINNPAGTGGMYGTGVTVDSVTRIRDAFIDSRILSENKSYGYWDKMEDLTHQLEMVYNEPSDSSLRSALDEFWKSIEDLNNAEGQSEQAATRKLVVESANNMTSIVHSMYDQMQQIGGKGAYAGGLNAIDHEIQVDVNSINGWGKEIAQLNKAILNAQGAGDDPNDLLDRRDALIADMSKLINVSVTTSDPDDYKVAVGGMVIAQGTESYSLYTKPDSSGKLHIFHSAQDKEIFPLDGEMKALTDFRDNTLKENIKYLNDFSITFADQFNEIHRNGFGLDGSTGNDFFREIPQVQANGIYKLTGNVYINSPESLINGDSSTSEPENFEKRVSRESTSDVSPAENIDVNKTFAEVSFNNALDTGTQIEITYNNKTYTSDKLSKYKSMQEFMNKINSDFEKLDGEVKLSYNEETDKFKITCVNANSDVTLKQFKFDTATQTKDYTITNGLWSSTNINFSTDMSYDNVSDRDSVDTLSNSTLTANDRLVINGNAISYNPFTDTVEDVIDRINNANIGVNASLDPTNRFVLRATKDFDYNMPTLDDTGGFLSSVGILSEGEAYLGSVSDTRNLLTNKIEYTPHEDAAFYFSVSDDLKADINKLATIGGDDLDLDGVVDSSYGPGDNTNSLKLAALRNKAIMNNGTTTLNDFYSSIVSQNAVQTKTAKSNFTTKDMLLQNLKDMQSEVSGVSLDEEFTNMIKFQHGYTASAKFISTMDDMIQTLLTLGR